MSLLKEIDVLENKIAAKDPIWVENQRLRSLVKKIDSSLKIQDSSLGITTFDIVLPEVTIQVSTQYYSGYLAKYLDGWFDAADVTDKPFVYSVFLVPKPTALRDMPHKSKLKAWHKVDMTDEKDVLDTVKKMLKDSK